MVKREQEGWWSVRRVFVNGYGVIGRRVAEAIARQRDMELVGIGKTKPDYKARLAASRGYRIYVPSEKEAQSFAAQGIEVGGLTADAVRAADLTVDATPTEPVRRTWRSTGSSANRRSSREARNPKSGRSPSSRSATTTRRGGRGT